MTAVGTAATVGGLGVSSEFDGASTASGKQQRQQNDEMSSEYHVTPDEGLPAVQRIIDEHGPNVMISLGAGEYVGSELTLDHGVQLVGQGRNSTTIKLADGANTDLVVTPNPDQENVMQVRLQELTLDGNEGQNSRGNAVYGAFWNGRFVDCDFVDAPDHGFWLAGSSASSTDDNYFRGCRFIGSGENGLQAGFNRKSWPALGVSRVESCWFGENGAHAVTMRGNANIVSNSKFYSNGETDVVIDRGDRNQVINNELSKDAPSGACIAIRAEKETNANANQIGGNIISGAYRNGVRCLADGARIIALRIHDNTIVGDSNLPRANRYGIKADGNQYDDCSAQDNTFSGTFSEAPLRLPSSWRTTDNVGVNG